MSDYTNSNLSRSDGVSLRGIALALVVIVAVIAGLAMLGTSGQPVEPTTVDSAVPAPVEPAPNTAPATGN